MVFFSTALIAAFSYALIDLYTDHASGKSVHSSAQILVVIISIIPLAFFPLNGLAVVQGAKIVRTGLNACRSCRANSLRPATLRPPAPPRSSTLPPPTRRRAI